MINSMDSTKIILIGDSKTGKTTISNRFWKDEFVENYKNTIGVDLFNHAVKYKEISINLQIWDTAGQE